MDKPITRLFDILKHREDFYPERAFFARKQEGAWKKHYLKEYQEQVDAISLGFLAHRIGKEDKIALISNGRPEWNYIDFAAQQIGAILVPIYPTISQNEYLYILQHSGAKLLILEEASLLRKIEPIRGQLTHLEGIYTIEPSEKTGSVSDLIADGASWGAPSLLEQLRKSITTDDIATLIYTSGTTGTPKGVLLSHKGIIMNIMGIKESPSKSWTTALSWMPMCHIYERMMNYLYQYLGFEIYYAENVALVAENAKEAQPNIMAAVPRFIEKMYDKIYRKGEKLKGVRKSIFFWALELGFRYDIDESKLSLWYKLQRKIADRLVYKQIRDSLGGKLEMLVSGGALIQPRLTRFFSCVGLNLYEGYGMTECSPLIAVTNSEKKGRKIGSVGFPLPGTKVSIDKETNEILCQGDNVMKGYYNEPELTNNALADGWLHTGDTGYFDQDGYLFLTGRTKSMFKTAMGKFVNPEVIEEKFKESPFILDMMVVGEGEKFAAAIISPDFEFLKEWQHRHNIPFCQSHDEMIADLQTLARYQKEVDKYNQQLGNTEQIKRFHLVSETWTPQNGFLTPTLKIKRKVVAAQYQKEIQKLFN